MYQGVQSGVVCSREKLGTSQRLSEGEIDYGILETKRHSTAVQKNEDNF